MSVLNESVNETSSKDDDNSINEEKVQDIPVVHDSTTNNSTRGYHVFGTPAASYHEPTSPVHQRLVPRISYQGVYYHPPPPMFLHPYPPSNDHFFFYPYPNSMPPQTPVHPTKAPVPNCPEGSYIRNGTTFFVQPGQENAQDSSSETSMTKNTPRPTNYDSATSLSFYTGSESNGNSTISIHAPIPTTISEISVVRNGMFPDSVTNCSISESLESPTTHRRRRRRRRRRRGPKNQTEALHEDSSN